MPSELVIGIDAGGTKTLACAFSATGECVAQVELAGIDLPLIGAVEAAARLKAVRDELEMTLPAGAVVSHAVLGAPGYGEIQRWSDEWDVVAASAMADWNPTVHNDVRMAFFSAFPDANGILVLAGTGSMGWAGWAGREERCGGWGPWFGDEGSAYDVGRLALQAAAAASDGRGPATLLSNSLPESLGATTLWEALGKLLTAPLEQRSRIAGLARAVDEAAQAGDLVATKLLSDAASQLAGLAAALQSRLGGSGMQVAYAGGLFRSQTLMREFSRLVSLNGIELAGQAVQAPVLGTLAMSRSTTAVSSNKED